MKNKKELDTSINIVLQEKKLKQNHAELVIYHMITSAKFLKYNDISKYVIFFKKIKWKHLYEKLEKLWIEKHWEYGVKKSGPSPYSTENYNQIKIDFEKIYKH